MKEQPTYGYVLDIKRDKDLNFSNEIQHDTVSTGNKLCHCQTGIDSLSMF